MAIGWGTSIQVAQVKAAQGPRARVVEITAMFRTDFWVCGLAPFGTDLIVLAVTNPIRQDGKERAERERPELRVISRTGGRFELESSDALSVTG